MAGSGIYKSYKRADAVLQEPGYQKAWLNTLSDFTLLQEPADLDENSVTGDIVKIETAHTWATGAGAMELFINNKSLEAPAETVGDIGSLKYKWTLKFFMKGDGPVAQDLAMSFLNEELIAFVQDGCPIEQYLQFGCDCISGEVSKSSFASATLASGAKGYSFEVDFYCRYFYNAALTLRS